MQTWHAVEELPAISTIKGHRGYADWRKHLPGDGSRSKMIRVTVDGVDQKGAVISADAAEGWVHRTKVDDNGQYMYDDKEFLEETVYGKVTIEVMGPECS